MNPILMLMYNTTEEQLDLSKLALESCLNQDIPIEKIAVVNNGSNVETSVWLNQMAAIYPVIHLYHFAVNHPPTLVSNNILGVLLKEHPHVLCVPNDAILPVNLYREMLRSPRGLVGAHMSGPPPPALVQDHVAKTIHEDAHLSVALIRKWAYDALMLKDGYYLDPGFFMYASDCDLKLRMAACGIHGAQLDIMCYHYGSACWRLARPEIGEAINRQADVDRGYFHQKWGFGIGSPEHEAAIKDIDFRG